MVVLPEFVQILKSIPTHKKRAKSLGLSLPHGNAQVDIGSAMAFLIVKVDELAPEEIPELGLVQGKVGISRVGTCW